MGMKLGGSSKKRIENAPKVKVKSQSKFSKVRNMFILLFLVIAGVLFLNVKSTIALRDTIEIVTLSSAVPQDGLIIEENMVKVEMSVSEYERMGLVTLSDGTTRKSVVTWEDRASIANKYAAYYIREATPIYWDGIGSETPKQYSYLYSMDGELLKLEIDATTFGQILVPGDKINIRASYSEDVYTLPTVEEYMLQQQTGISAQTTVTQQILLFNNVSILDMLNAAGESIFDMYYELLSYSTEVQQSIIATDEFIEAVQPASILLNVTPEEADRYMSIQASGPTYMMTLLPRTSSNAITEVLSELSVGFARD